MLAYIKVTLLSFRLLPLLCSLLPPPAFLPLLFSLLNYNFSFLMIPFALASGDTSNTLQPNILECDGIHYLYARVC